MNNQNFYRKCLINFKKCIDLIILVLVISFLIYDIMSIIISLIESFSKLGLNNDFIIFMAESSTTDNHTTTVQVIHTDGSWSNGIRSLFIYGTGALRLTLLRAGGSPSSRAFVISTTVGTDALGKMLHNAINDPKYVLSHVNNWKTIWDGKSDSAAHMYVEGDKETSSMVDTIQSSSLSNIESNTTSITKFIPDNNGLDDISNKIVSYIMNTLRPILEPIKVNYSNEILANQLNDISIILFMMSILIIILLIAFMFNILVYLNSDRISNYFTNKYIKWYINFNKKIIGIELLFLGSSILYFMYILSYGIHFLATHPIIFT